MTTTARPVPVPQVRAAHRPPRGSVLLRLAATTDHKLIGIMYLVAAFGFFMVGGALAMLMRTELAVPGLQFLSAEQNNQLFTVHGTVMMLLYATPVLFGFANVVLPLQIGSPDVAFPRLNALSFWLFLIGGLIVIGGFATPGGAADFGWFGYTPLSRATGSPGVGGDLWATGLILTFLVHHWLGNEGMPRRYADYLPSDGFTVLNTISTIGAYLVGASTLPFIYNVVRSYRYGQTADADDPWGYGNSLEWATTCPPPRHNFTDLPRIRSERPAFDLHYPHVSAGSSGERRRHD